MGGSDAANGGGKGSAPQPRGLGSGLAKACPKADGLTQKTYRSYRRRLSLFAKQRQRHGRDTAVERAFLAVSLLSDAAWEATEQLALDGVENAENPFKPVFELLDQLYQHEDLVEVPNPCEEFFQEFRTKRCRRT